VQRNRIDFTAIPQPFHIAFPTVAHQWSCEIAFILQLFRNDSAHKLRIKCAAFPKPFCEAISQPFSSRSAAIANQIRSDCGPNAQRLSIKCAAIEHQMRSDCTSNMQRLRIKYAAQCSPFAAI
jgi:hypothetical protein